MVCLHMYINIILFNDTNRICGYVGFRHLLRHSRLSGSEIPCSWVCLVLDACYKHPMCVGLIISALAVVGRVWQSNQVKITHILILFYSNENEILNTFYTIFINERQTFTQYYWKVYEHLHYFFACSIGITTMNLLVFCNNNIARMQLLLMSINVEVSRFI